MNEISLSDHVREQIRRYEAGRLETEDNWRKNYARAKKRKRVAIRTALIQSAESLFTLRLKKLIEGVQDFRDALDAPLPTNVVKLDRGDKESRFISGLDGERRVLKTLNGLCRKPCTALLGYNGTKGEIDVVLVGRYGVTAIEVKNKTGEICSDGDSWWRIKSGQREWIQDAGGRSPSVQLNECASELQAILSSSGLRIPIRRIVVLAHPNARYGNPFSPSVDWACKIEHLNRRVLFNPLPEETLDRDCIRRICAVIVQAHRVKASGQLLPLYEERYQNVGRVSWRPGNISTPKLVLCAILLSAVLRVLFAVAFAGLNQQRTEAIPAQTTTETTPPVKKTWKSYHKAAKRANGARVPGNKGPATGQVMTP